jgi:hypothetical protein
MRPDHGLLHTFLRTALMMTLCVRSFQQEGIPDAYVCRLLPLKAPSVESPDCALREQ